MHRHTLASVSALRYIISAADPGFPIVEDADPLGAGGTDLRYGRFSVKMCAKKKESGPVGGVSARPLDQPMLLFQILNKLYCEGPFTPGIDYQSMPLDQGVKHS